MKKPKPRTITVEIDHSHDPHSQRVSFTEDAHLTITQPVELACNHCRLSMTVEHTIRVVEIK